MLVSAVLTVVSAALYAACFPPLALWPLVLVALVPFFIALSRHGVAGGAVLGLLWGTAMAAGTGTWFPAMVSDYFEQPAWVGWGSLPAIGIAHAGIYCAVFGAWVGWLARRRVASPWLVAVGWCGWELARARAFGGDPWALSGYAVMRWSTFIQIADLGGPYLPGLLIAAVNALCAATVAPALRGRRPARSLVTVVVVVIGALGYGRWRLGAIPSTGSVPVAIVQAGVGRGMRWRPEYERVGLAEHLTLSREAMSTKPLLVVWPEYAVSFYLQELTPQRDELLAGAQRLGADLVLGGPHYEFTPGGDTVYHNSLFVVRRGRVAGRYDKRRLVPFAETTGTTAYTAGSGPAVLSSDAGRLGMLICFEAMYPELVRETVGAGAQVLVNLSNDSWFGSESAARLHLEMATMRAIETRRWLLRAAPTGYSGIIDPSGRATALSGFGHPEVLHAMIDPSDAVTVYERIGDLPLVVCLAVAVLWSLAGGRPRARPRA